MKKPSLLFFSVFLAFLCFVPTSHAIPYYYTFEGTVSSIEGWRPELVRSLGYNETDSIEYKVLIDFERLGEKTLHDGSITVFNHPSNPFDQSYSYYIDYISGDALPEINGGSHNNPDDIVEYNFFQSNWSNQGAQVRFQNNFKLLSADNYLYIYNFSYKSIADFQGDPSIPAFNVGDNFSGFNQVYDATGEDNSFGTLLSTLTLTNIVPVGTTTVPEPMTFILFSTGIIGGYLKKRFA